MLYHRASQVFADTGEWHVPRTLGHSQRQLCSSGHWLFWSVCLLSLLLVLCSLPGLYFSHLTAQAQDPWLPFSSPFPSTHHSQSPLLFWLPKCWFFIFFFFHESFTPLLVILIIFSELFFLFQSCPPIVPSLVQPSFLPFLALIDLFALALRLCVSVFILTISSFDPSVLDVLLLPVPLADASRNINKGASGTGPSSEFSCLSHQLLGKPSVFPGKEEPWTFLISSSEMSQ